MFLYFYRLHSDLRLSKYLLSIEHFPDFSKKNRIISYMIPGTQLSFYDINIYF